MTNRIQWRLGALASAVALLGSLASFEAHALALGRITVQSALGEPLRAEIDIADINAEEMASLKVGPASADAFRAAGLEYTSAVVELQISLQKRANGRSFLRLSSTRPVTEPFVDLILDASWSSGRIVRDYTMLFDPPTLRQSGSPMAAAPVPITPTAPILSRPAPPPSAPPAVVPPAATGIGSIPYSPPPAAVAAARPAPVAKAPPPPPARTSEPVRSSSGQQTTVQAGDTAGKIAAQNKPANVSLDQMLVALLNSNPGAFIGGNVNRLKSGAVLDLPTAEEAAAVSSAEASRTIVAQARDFNDFRRKFAQNVPTAQVGAANRQAAGQVQAKVEDRTPGAVVPDKLTLSKGAVQSKVAAEEKIAKERQAKEASARVAELSKNIGDLNKIAVAPAVASSAVKPAGTTAAQPVKAASTPSVVAIPAPVAVATAVSPSPAPVAASAASTPAAPKAATTTIAPVTPAVTAAVTNTSTTAALTPASAPLAAVAAAASAPVASASQPAPAAAVAASATASTPAPAPMPAPAEVKKPAPPPPPPPPEPSLLDELTSSPFVLPGLGVLLAALLAGFGFYRFRQRKNSAQVDSSFLESRLQPDSFFGASGGQRIDTNEGGATGSSLVYSPSQLDAAGDVDPVAEADVYLAYGRDLQAEEILKEAMRTNSTRVAIHAKLMEIYAKRRDVKAFEVVAVEAFNLTRGEGPEWAYIGEMGRDLDPENPMYQPGGKPVSMADRKDAGGLKDSAPAFGSSTLPQAIQPQFEESSASVDFDLDLDFSIGDDAAAPPPPPAPVSAPPPAARAAPPQPAPEPTVSMKPAPLSDPLFDGLDMDFGTGTMALKPSFQAPAPVPAPAPVAKPVAVKPVEIEPLPLMLDEGLTFSIDPPSPPPPPTPKPAPAVMDSGMLEFDLGSLSLELDDEPPTESPGVTAASADDDHLETKFSLAEEFRALGDMDGARSLAEEVLAEASGSLKNKAQAFLNALS